jgi:hypothetical protein
MEKMICGEILCHPTTTIAGRPVIYLTNAYLGRS